ncbi:reverse transcriptase domain-containing protein [Lysinibacillus fusiformis]|uniref:reverse transcriptase domain-containing protein n=1 Tax=Lysinibacillus fusiformis TaxID=28031 RepID=UPI00215B07EF|nr:reverse transcriptase domain-containing protein [Lysinibacillus fusiformis]MCR8855190.1 reverse transcriptase domain-containing protein [Lysinibacillus fusiformis]
MNRSNGPRGLHGLPSSSKVNWSKYKMKKYLHFDKRIDLIKDEHMKVNLQDPSWVASYAFLPSIHFKIEYKKYITLKNEKGEKFKKKDKKPREIYYAAHKDSYIYKYYGDLLNNAYNDYAFESRIDDIAIAYRNNKRGKNSIDYAYEVFDFLLKQDQAIVIALDFKSFFDNIDHKPLKQKIKVVLDVEELPKDWYKIYKSITHYSYVEKEDIEQFLLDKYGKKKLKKIRSRLPQIMEPAEFRQFKQGKIEVNPNSYGIPQGSGMSAVCSNVHLIDFDKEVLEWTKQKHPDALYRRYCDDLIVVIPTANATVELLEKLKNELMKRIDRYKADGLIIQEKKTELRLYKDQTIFNEKMEISALDYLGFVIHKNVIRIRENSLFKYYSRAYKKVKTSKRVSYATKRPGPKRKLYNLYTHLGHKYLGYGNFYAYAKKAHNIMSKLPCKSKIKKQTKRHWWKIHKRLYD